MIPRYQSLAMKNLWDDPTKFRLWLEIEINFLEAYLLAYQREDKELIARLRVFLANADWQDFAAKVEAKELLLKHDVIAFLQVAEDGLKHDARLLHEGLTSSDIVDSALALRLAQAAFLIGESMTSLINALWQKAEKLRGIIVLGRTHGQAAQPTTMAIKLLGFASEFARGLERLNRAQEEIAVGKFSGAVGTYAYASPMIEEEALNRLGLKNETVATQVVARDRHAVFFSTLAIIGGSLERMAVEIRLLSHSGVKEVFEPFSKDQLGSSAMPHKKNPIQSENITGIARLLRAYAMASLEDQALWHERDISHSSVERVIAPDATSIAEFALKRMEGVIRDLVIDEERIAENLAQEGDLIYSQGVLLALVQKGMMRHEAYLLVQKASHSSAKTHSFREALIKLGVDRTLNDQELAAIFSPKAHLAFEDTFFKRVREEIEALPMLRPALKFSHDQR